MFIFAIEVLSKALNSLFHNENFKGYDMPEWSDKINHLAYTGDTIIFMSTNVASLKLIMNIHEKYEV